MVIGSVIVLSSVQSLNRVQLFATPWTAAHLPVHHQLPELTQTHAHRVGDAIQPSHPLSSLLLLPSIFPSIRIFSNESVLRIRWPYYWSFSFIISPSSAHSGLNSQESSPTSQFKRFNSLALSFLYSPTLTSIHDHWKNRSLD